MFPAVTPIPPRPRALPYRDDAWYGVEGSSVTNIALAVDTVYCHPIFLDIATPVRRIAATIGTSVAGSLLRLSFYADRGAGQAGPGSAIVTSMTEYDMGQAAETPIELDFGTARFLPRGWYWGLARGGGAAQPQPRTNGPAATANSEIQRLFGQLTPRNVFAAGSNPNSTTRLTFALPYTDPWPAFAPPATFGTNAPGNPQIAWRRN